jgi:ubiquinone/menaquinone biosynthesis C-methylase UbiE
MTDAWQQLAGEYAAHRSGYSNELYDTIAAFGLRRGAKVLDIGCGTGIASAPFAANGFPVTGVDSSPAMLAKAKERLPNVELVEGSAEKLPFPEERFDVIVSANVFHWLDRSKALAEAQRVLRPGGVLAIWWKQLMDQDAVNELRGRTFHELGMEPPKTGLTGGFREFYASEQLCGQTLRVIPWRTSTTIERHMGYERSRFSTRHALGDRSERYFSMLERKLHERFGEGDAAVPLAYIQYLYLAKKR